MSGYLWLAALVLASSVATFIWGVARVVTYLLERRRKGRERRRKERVRSAVISYFLSPCCDDFVDVEWVAYQLLGWSWDGPTEKLKKNFSHLERALFEEAKAEARLAAEDLLAEGKLARYVETFVCREEEEAREFTLPGVFALTPDGSALVARMRADLARRAGRK